ncbi:MAG: GAF domain-containing protein, partial [Terriglobia bacterium]
MLRSEAVIGTVSVIRPAPGPLTEKQFSLLQIFADQAVIAIENVRLFNETKEALERQTATGEILASMSGSMTDTQPVFDAIVRNLLRLFGTSFALVALVRDGMVEIAGIEGEGNLQKLADRYPVPLDDRTHLGKVILEGRASQLVPIVGNPASPPATAQFAQELGYDGQICSPMIREGKVIGAIVTARRDPVPFDDKQVTLIKAFADQAVIAIENVRLFNETKEALERQTATAEILKVIAGSPADVRPVFDSIAESAARLCDATDIIVQLRDGDRIRNAAHFGKIPHFPLGLLGSITPHTLSGRALIEARQLHILDVQAEAAEFPRGAEVAREFGHRTILMTPLVRDGKAIGTIMARRTEVRAFSDKQMTLAQTFADQAVIAIENVRLFKELQERTDALTNSVGQLRALGEVSQAIN